MFCYTLFETTILIIPNSRWTSKTNHPKCKIEVCAIPNSRYVDDKFHIIIYKDYNIFFWNEVNKILLATANNWHSIFKLG